MANLRRKVDRKKKETGWLYHKLLREFTAVYVFFMFVIYPVYYQNKYYNMGDAKWQFFRVVTFTAGAVLAVFFLLYMMELTRKHEFENYVRNIKFSVVDWFVAVYMAAVVVSVLLSPYKDQVIWGYDGWYMGLIAQTCFVLIYFFVSRYWRWDQSAILLYLATAFLVFLLAILMRFRIDPLEMYKDLDEKYIINFLSTLGQATWYSSYMVLLFPLGMFAFWFYDNKYIRIFSGIFTAVGFMTMVTQNSDSAFVAFGVMFFVMFWISMESNKRFERFLEVVIMCLASFKFMGICQRLFPENAVQLDALPVFCSQHPLIWVFLAIAIVVYFCFRQMEKSGAIDVSGVKILRVIALAVVLIGGIAAVVYIYLNTTGRLPENMKSSNNYLLFDEYWGNNRGSSWIFAAKSFFKGSLIRKLFGCGPDGFSSFVYSFFGAELAAKWGENTVLTCAHNEWLNALVNLGIVGVTAYIGIFVSAFRRFLKKADDYPELIAIAVSIVCYMGHNFFCYQQIICTPVIFILMGAGESVIRYGKIRE